MRIARLPLANLERVPLEHGDVLLSSFPAAYELGTGDVVLLGDERLLVVQAARTTVEYVGLIGPSSRAALAVRPMAALTVE